MTDCPHYAEQVHPDYCVFCREIELRAEVERLKADKDVQRSQARNAAYEAEIDRLTAENEQLRREIRRGENTYHEGYAAGFKKSEADNRRTT